MVTTNDDEYVEKLRHIRSHGEKQYKSFIEAIYSGLEGGPMKSHGKKEEYKSFMIGHNYRMPEIEAAIGCAQLRKLPRFLEERRRNATLLTERLSGIKRLQLPIEPRDCKHCWYL